MEEKGTRKECKVKEEEETRNWAERETGGRGRGEGGTACRKDRFGGRVHGVCKTNIVRLSSHLPTDSETTSSTLVIGFIYIVKMVN